MNVPEKKILKKLLKRVKFKKNHFDKFSVKHNVIFLVKLYMYTLQNQLFSRKNSLSYLHKLFFWKWVAW